jgi:hypothetical protein
MARCAGERGGVPLGNEENTSRHPDSGSSDRPKAADVLVREAPDDEEDEPKDDDDNKEEDDENGEQDGYSE